MDPRYFPPADTRIGPPAPAGWPPPAGPPPTAPRASDNRLRWILGLVVSAVIGPLVVFFLIRDGGPLNHKGPASMGGTISDVQIATLNPCCSFSVNFTLEGFTGQTATVAAIVTDYYSGATADPVTAFSAVPDADKDQASFTTDIPMSGFPPGDYLVTFVLYAPNGNELARMDSATITLN